MAAVAATGTAAAPSDASLATPTVVTIQEQQLSVYPSTLPSGFTPPSPGTTKEGHEYLVVRTAAGASAVVLVTVENGPLNLQYGAEKVGKGEQLKINAGDFPTLAATGLHSPAELQRTRSITGKPVAELTRLGRPGMASGIGFLAVDENTLSVLRGDNEMVRRLGLKHPDLARPIFHVWNLLLREYELGKLGRFKDDVGSFWYHGREIHLRSQRTKGFQESIFNDEIKGAFDIELWRELDAGERRLLNAAYAHLSAAEREVMMGRLTRLRTGEMQPYYIMRYGFYEGHTEYRVDPIALAAIFGLKSLADIETTFSAELDQVLTRHFTAKANAPATSAGKAQIGSPGGLLPPTITLCLLATVAWAQDPTPKAAVAPVKSPAMRVIISTDFPPLDVIPVKGVKKGDPPEKCSDPDDVQSMVRFLLYANEFDVEGLIASAGTFANVARKQNILDMLDRYDQVDENLRRHDARYPTAEKLRSITWQGRDGTWGAPAVGTKTKPINQILSEGRDSEASDAIIRIVDRPDPRPVWVCVWGGSCEVAQAIWQVRATRSPAELERFLGKLRLYLIAKQDATTDWLLESFPNLFIILSEKNYMGMFWVSSGGDRNVADLAWVNAHIREGHGPLGAAYPKSGWDPSVPGIWEGDTPSFLHLVSAVRGLNDPERPDQPGWGGKFVRRDPSKNHWFDDPAGGKTVSKWRVDVQADFGRRADWMLP